jgi:hypothetical protein
VSAAAAVRLDHELVHAQTVTPQYAVEVVTANWGSHTFEADLAASIKSAAKGRELVTVIKDEQPGNFLAVFK